MRYLYKRFAKYYDLIYSEKDYDKEIRFVERLAKKHRIKGKDVLDVACGTGNHAVLLKKKGFSVIGIDLNKEMLAVARKKTKSIRFLQGDMRRFKLKKRFDIILCMFSAMSYNQNYNELEKTLKNFYSHLKEKGLLVFDLGIYEERWDLKLGVDVIRCQYKGADLVRFARSTRQGDYGIINMAYIMFKDKKFTFGHEKHKMYIFKALNIKKAAEKVGFKVKLYDAFSGKPWNKKNKKQLVISAVKE